MDLILCILGKIYEGEKTILNAVLPWDFFANISLNNIFFLRKERQLYSTKNVATLPLSFLSPLF